MNLIKKPSWEIKENYVTDERLVTNRRKFLNSLTAVTVGSVINGSLFGNSVWANENLQKINNSFKNKELSINARITPETLSSKYNNFFEFGSTKNIWKEAQKLSTDGWSINISGLVEKPLKLDTDSLISKFSLEERIYRHRCVEAWSMVVPWTGFKLSKLVAFAQPLSTAKFVEFKTFFTPKEATEQRARWYPWPYTEGLTIEEATNELAFMVVGAYGKILHKQFGAPIRLHLPWKYGFKSIKSIVEINFTSTRPVSFWETLANNEYGFWANVNPEVPHPRWSQKTERVLGGDTRNTEIYNGYGPQVAGLYSKFQNLGNSLFR